ncbi:MAG: aminotransferase class V-fold PLP-dependent enzyme [Actinomycetota bacterium]|nr:aminotransferase class V-fold PLP-dependent enzyme [Actinomycetota bacterium]
MTADSPMRLGAEREPVLDRAAAMVARAWRSFDDARESEPEIGSALAELLSEPMPTSGRDPMAALDELEAVLDHSIAQARPRYLAFVGSSGLEIGAVADLLAHSYDVNLAVDARAASRLEDQTAEWLAEFLGYPAAGGWFTSGGTISNLSGLAAARERALPGARRTGMAGVTGALYCSAEAHYSVSRAAELLGLGSDAVRDIPVDHYTRQMRTPLLRAAIEADQASGVVPVAVVATAGTTLTGAVDPLDEVADICEELGVWMHIDGAYGLPAAATSRRPIFVGMERADSLCVDAHKWMFVPKACSALLVRDPSALAAVFSHDEAYMPHDEVVPNAVDLTLEYSRPMRALKLWLAFRVHGADEFRAALERNLAQARLCHDLASAATDFEVMPLRPTLSVVPVRHLVPGCPDIDLHNAALTDALQRDGRVYVSPATIDEQEWLRPCFTNVRTRTHDVHVFLDVARELGRAICPGHE